MRKKAKRIYGILLSMSMLLTLLSVPVWAAEPVETGAGYELEQEHTEDCYTLTENCVHEHTLECYPQITETGTVSGNDVMETVEAQPTECAHVCSEESGCISPELNCPYEREDVEERQEKTVKREEIATYTGLTVPNNGGVQELSQNAMNTFKDSESGTYYLPAGNYKLIENITLDDQLKISSDIMVSLDLNGHTITTSGSASYINIGVHANAELDITDTSQDGNGKISVESPKGIEINYSAKLKIYAGTVNSFICFYGNQSELYIYGGNVKGNIGFVPVSQIQISDTKLYAYGGTVEGNLQIPYNQLTIYGPGSGTLPTTFMGTVTNSTIQDGIFQGTVKESKIQGGIFSGSVEETCQIEDSAKVTVNFNTGGGGTISQQKVLRGQKAQDPGDSVRDGYVFDGWYVSGNPNSKWNFSDSVTENLNLEAHWNIVYQVTLQTNGGTIAAGKEIKSYTGGTTAALPGAGDITREGYSFEGWYEDSSFSGSPVTEISSSDTGDKTFYAKWSANTYIVKLETNGGKIADGKDVTAYTCGTGAALPGAGDITREGYTFEGWYEDSSLSGFPVTEISSTDTGDKTFYAKWKQNTVPVPAGESEHNNTNHDNTGDANESGGTTPVIYPTLTFDTCGGSSIKVVRAFKGHTINLSGYLPIREGYEFSGWYADQNLTRPITEIRLDGNRTVYAGWIKQAEQAGEDSKPKAAPAQLIVNDSEKAVSKDNGQSLIENYKPGAMDTPEDTGDNQKPTMDNSPADDSSKPDDSANLAPEKTSGNNPGILIVCAFAGAALIGVIIYIIYRKESKGRR